MHDALVEYIVYFYLDALLLAIKTYKVHDLGECARYAELTYDMLEANIMLMRPVESRPLVVR